MLVLAITDIPRIISLFEHVDDEQTEIILVSDLHRALDQLDNRNPDLVIFQNYLSGFSADIIYKHLCSQLKGRTIRFALISGTTLASLPDHLEMVLDPGTPEPELTSALHQLLGLTAIPPSPAQTPEPQAEYTGTTYPVLLHSPPEQITDEPGTYTAPGIGKQGIISDFSLQLSATSTELQYEDQEEEEPPRLSAEQAAPQTIDLQAEETAPAWYTRPAVIVSAGTLAAVIAISLIQNHFNQSTSQKVGAVKPSPQVQHSTSRQSKPPAKAAEQPARPPQLSKLPSFIPRDSKDRQYTKEHPGWELYRGQANEYRVFRNKEGIIKAVQILDRSGAGIQESFYQLVLSELAGTSAVTSASTETKEGYEIKHGTVAALKLVQYRDAQGGRLRGFVITWP